MHLIIRKFLSLWPARRQPLVFGLVILTIMTIFAFSLSLYALLHSGESLKLSAVSLDENSGIPFPTVVAAGGEWGRLQAMNVVPVQDGGLALQWHLLAWPNSWFDRFPLTLDQNLNSARGVQSEESSYWINSDRLGKRQSSGISMCPQTNPLTPSPARIWDSTMVNPGQHLGEVWLSDSMVEQTHPDLSGVVKVNPINLRPVPAPDSHGTHIAGLMSALRNGEGTVGVVPGLHISLYPLAVTFTKNGPRVSGKEVLESLDSIIVSLVARKSQSEGGGRVILLSWAFYESDGLSREFTDALETRIRKILEHDVALIVPAGNLEGGRKSAGQRIFPASWSGRFHELTGSLLPVGALDVCSRPAWFTNFAVNDLGTTLLAPGERIFSTLTKKDFGFMSGSSASAAQVAAVLALTSSQYPDVDMKTQVHTLLRTSMPVTSNSERLTSFDAPSLVQGLMAEYGWIARH